MYEGGEVGGKGGERVGCEGLCECAKLMLLCLHLLLDVEGELLLPLWVEPSPKVGQTQVEEDSLARRDG